MSHGSETMNDLLEVMDGPKTDFPLHEIHNDPSKGYSLLTVFDRSGNALFQSGADAEADPVWLESLKKTALVQLEKNSITQFQFPRNEHGSPLNVVAVRLDSSVVLLAWSGDLDATKKSWSELEKPSETIMKLLGVLVETIHSDLEENNRLATRIEHFRAEMKTLWESQSNAASEILEQRQRHLQEEQQRCHTQKLESVGQLAAGIAHEINTPTQYIGDNITFLCEAFQTLGEPLRYLIKLATQPKKTEESYEMLDRIISMIHTDEAEYLVNEIPHAIQQSQDGLQRVAQIVRSMKEFSHPDSQAKKEIDLNRALQNTLVVSRSEWKYVATVQTDFQENLPTVLAHEGECNQVFLNLIVNAAHAIRQRYIDQSDIQGLITVQTRAGEGHVEIRIGDNASGIPVEIQERIFDPFFTTKEVGQGTGQGLAISHAIIVKRHGGTLTFETEQGKGTTFIIRLPLENLNHQ